MYTLAGLDFPELHDTPTARCGRLGHGGVILRYMQLCKNTASVTFLDKDKHDAPQDHPGLRALAVYITFLLADQKNRD